MPLRGRRWSKDRKVANRRVNQCAGDGAAWVLLSDAALDVAL